MQDTQSPWVWLVSSILASRLALAKANFDIVKAVFEDAVVACNVTVRDSNTIAEDTLFVVQYLKREWYS
jgi:hypothetical protein